MGLIGLFLGVGILIGMIYFTYVVIVEYIKDYKKEKNKNKEDRPD